MFALLIGLFLPGGPVWAESPMTGAEFEAYTQGKTLHFSDQAGNAGAEQYLPNRQVRWGDPDGNCLTGQWYEEGPMICFLYEDRSEPRCWGIYKRESGLVAIFGNDPVNSALFETGQSRAPVFCRGPDVGV